MFCSNCGQATNDNEKFCNKCGSDLKSLNSEKKQTFTKKKRKTPILLIVLLVITFLIILGQIMSGVGNNLPTSSSEQSKNSLTYITKDEIIKGKDWEINVNDVYFAQRINPPDQSGFYTYYQVKDTSNTYLCITLNAKNLSNLELKASSIATVKVKYNNNYTYTSFSAIPDKTTGFTYTNIYNVKPLTNSTIYYFAEMPNTISEETETPIQIEIKFENKTYYYNFR